MWPKKYLSEHHHLQHILQFKPVNISKSSIASKIKSISGTFPTCSLCFTPITKRSIKISFCKITYTERVESKTDSLAKLFTSGKSLDNVKSFFICLMVGKRVWEIAVKSGRLFKIFLQKHISGNEIDWNKFMLIWTSQFDLSPRSQPFPKQNDIKYLSNKMTDLPHSSFKRLEHLVGGYVQYKTALLLSAIHTMYAKIESRTQSNCQFVSFGCLWLKINPVLCSLTHLERCK